MKQLTTALYNHFQGNVTTLATCWKVTRRDKTVMGFTDHDVSLTVDGLRYHASSGYFRTAIANTASTAVDNLEISGFLDNDSISEVDLRNGAYDFAEVEIFAVNWMDLNQGICRLRYGLFGEVTIRPSGMFVVELRGLLQLLSQTIGETISPDCRADLGDNRCKVKLMPPARNGGQRYEAGEVVVVPTQHDMTSFNLPIRNQNFDWYQTTKYYMWEAFGGHFANYPNDPAPGTYYYLKPAEEVGRIRRRLDRIPSGRGSGFPTGFDIGWQAKAKELGWEISVLVEVVRIEGIGGAANEANIHVLWSEASPYRVIPQSETYVSMVESFSTTIPANASDVRITFRWRHVGTEAPVLPPAFQIGKPTVVWEGVPFTDPSLGFNTISNLTSSTPEWGTYVGASPGNINIRPEFGTAYGYSSTAWVSYLPSQTVPIANSGVDLGIVDQGMYKIKCKAFIGSDDWGFQARTLMDCRSATNALLATFDTGYVSLRPASEWHEFEFGGELPPGTRSVVFRLMGRAGPERQGDGQSVRVYYDRIEARIEHIDIEDDRFIMFGGVEYRAITTGTSDATPPNFTHTLGEVVTDGTMQWLCIQPKYTFLGTIGQVFSNSEFTVPGIDAPNDWFTWGVLRFLDGYNRSRGIEVLNWNNTTKRFKLMLPALT
ncbi:MAG: DUF2163 domain-containing protein, partial [Paracoccus sp. BP8]